MVFFATRFSRQLFGLLIAATCSSGVWSEETCKQLKTSDLKKDYIMKARNALAEKDKWNVEALYRDFSVWNQELGQVRGKNTSPHWPGLLAYQGKLADPEAILAFLDRYFEYDRKISKLRTYAHLRFDEDLGNDECKKNFDIISSLAYDFVQEFSWVEPELLSVKEEVFQKLLSHPKLQLYRFFLEKIGKMRPHVLSAELEALLASSNKVLDTAHRAFGALNHADLIFPNVKDSKGKEHPLSNGTYLAYMRNPDRELRKNAFCALHQTFDGHIHTFCELLNGQMQGHFYLAKARKFPDCLTAALLPNQIDSAVYKNLIACVEKFLPEMHAYIALRKKILGVEEVHAYDLYVPLVEETHTSIPYAQACKLVVDSIAVLGKPYQEAVKKGLFEERWVDAYETAKKRSGAYSSGCYDSMPYILMNYQETLNDVFTLAHEAGHSMHTFLSSKTQPYVYANYPIFVAEVASTFNELLLLKLLKAQAQSKQEKAYLIQHEIDTIRATLFRQTLFAEFELQLHQWVEEGVPLTPALLKEYYLQLNKKYYGPDFVLDGELAAEWARIPHFYYNFYVYQYATGLSAAIALFQRVNQEEGACKKYLQFLSSGGSSYPIALLQKAGVNMHSDEAVRSAMQVFRELVAELQETVDVHNPVRSAK